MSMQQSNLAGETVKAKMVRGDKEEKTKGSGGRGVLRVPRALTLGINHAIFWIFGRVAAL